MNTLSYKPGYYIRGRTKGGKPVCRASSKKPQSHKRDTTKVQEEKKLTLDDLAAMDAKEFDTSPFNSPPR